MANADKSLQVPTEKIRLEIVTPEGLAFNEFVDEFTAPSTVGQVGVLPGHLPLLAVLRTGLVTYRRDGESISYAIGPGFIEVVDDRAVLLTDKLCEKDSIDIVDVRLNWKKVQSDLDAWQGDPGAPEFLALMTEEQWIAALLELFGDPPAPTMRQEAPRSFLDTLSSEPVSSQDAQNPSAD